MQYHSTGDFNIEECILTSHKGEQIDISQLFGQLNIYESIFSNTLSGNITLVDAIGLIEGMPIIGEETISIKLSRLENIIIDGTFKVYKISNRIKTKDHTEAYSLHFTSYEQISCMGKSISRAYVGKKISDIIENVFTNFIKTPKRYLIEPSKYLHKLIIPRMSPFESINWLVSQAVSQTNIGADYLAYEDLDGFKVISLETLYTRPSKLIYHKSTANLLSPGSSNDRTELDSDRTSIVEMYMKSTNDVLTNISTGAFANKITTFDPIRKLHDSHEYFMVNKFDQLTNLNSSKLNSNKFIGFTGISNSRFIVTDIGMSNQSHINALDKTIFNDNPENYLQSRISQINRILGGHQFVIKVPGNKVRVGEKVTLNLNSNIPGNTEEIDLSSYGDYLITKIRHKIEPDNYFQEMEIARDSGTQKHEQ